MIERVESLLLIDGLPVHSGREMAILANWTLSRLTSSEETVEKSGKLYSTGNPIGMATKEEPDARTSASPSDLPQPQAM